MEEYFEKIDGSRVRSPRAYWAYCWIADTGMVLFRKGGVAFVLVSVCLLIVHIVDKVPDAVRGIFFVVSLIWFAILAVCGVIQFLITAVFFVRYSLRQLILTFLITNALVTAAILAPGGTKVYPIAGLFLELAVISIFIIVQAPGGETETANTTPGYEFISGPEVDD